MSVERRADRAGQGREREEEGEQRAGARAEIDKHAGLTSFRSSAQNRSRFKSLSSTPKGCMKAKATSQRDEVKGSQRKTGAGTHHLDFGSDGFDAGQGERDDGDAVHLTSDGTLRKVSRGDLCRSLRTPLPPYKGIIWRKHKVRLLRRVNEWKRNAP